VDDLRRLEQVLGCDWDKQEFEPDASDVFVYRQDDLSGDALACVLNLEPDIGSWPVQYCELLGVPWSGWLTDAMLNVWLPSNCSTYL